MGANTVPTLSASSELYLLTNRLNISDAYCTTEYSLNPSHVLFYT